MGLESYQGYQPYRAPTFLSGPFGKAWMGALGYVKDYLVSLSAQAVKSRMPLSAPPDALAAIGRERGIVRGIGESDAAYAARVQEAWTSWVWGGTPFGLLTQLAAAGYPGPGVVLLQALANGYSLDVAQDLVITTLNSGGWLMDATPFWSKFTVLFTYPLPPRWLTGGWSSVYHSGAGIGTVTPSGTATADARFMVLVKTNGGVGAGTITYSTDDGQTSTGPITIPASLTAGGCTLLFSGTFTAGDCYSFAPAFSVPADGSSESLLIKQIVNSWKPAYGTVARYIIHTGGFIIGWPVGNKIGAPPTGGTPGGFPITVGNTSSTTWTG